MQNQQFHHFGYLVHGDGVMVIAAKVAWHLKLISLFYIYILNQQFHYYIYKYIYIYIYISVQ